MTDWAFADFLLTIAYVSGTAPMVYLMWASGYLSLLVRAARRNHWGLGGGDPPEDWLT